MALTVVVCDEYGDLACCLLGKWKMSGKPTKNHPEGWAIKFSESYKMKSATFKEVMPTKPISKSANESPFTSP